MYRDPLTGLAMRELFLHGTAQMLERARREGRGLLVGIVDLQRMRQVNESLGRAAGDQILREVAGRIARTAPQDALAGRLAGGQFAVASFGGASEGTMAHLVEAVLDEVSQPVAHDGKPITLAANAGVAVFPDDGEDAEALCQRAEAALRMAKSRHERLVFYSPEMSARMTDRLALEHRLRDAVAAEQFVLHYQPKLDLASGRPSGTEALVRWRSSERGLVPPAHFIPVLEETGMIREAGRWVLAEAARAQVRWRSAGIDPGATSVNVSPLQLRQRDFVADVLGTIREAGAAPAQIELEVTESSVIENLAENIPRLAALREAGLKIALDDFGTGYSSLSYLARLPLDALKIDRSFLVHLASERKVRTLTSAIVQLAHALELRVIAEGVETEAQAQVLRELGCDEMQGSLAAQPMAEEELLEFLRK
ncbi:MAG TPA: bifunctional diguanylate cyclase/phosphodiesterase [Burkholderiales bacterium]|nr:bifunctional diguanylate cyclase/phosphodiesterase [Burkholderiales bacterium]